MAGDFPLFQKVSRSCHFSAMAEDHNARRLLGKDYDFDTLFKEEEAKRVKKCSIRKEEKKQRQRQYQLDTQIGNPEVKRKKRFNIKMSRAAKRKAASQGSDPEARIDPVAIMTENRERRDQRLKKFSDNVDALRTMTEEANEMGKSTDLFLAVAVSNYSHPCFSHFIHRQTRLTRKCSIGGWKVK